MVLEGAPFLRFEDLGDARASAFGEFQFFQKLPLSFDSDNAGPQNGRSPGPQVE
jgi:hypothetical protein